MTDPRLLLQGLKEYHSSLMMLRESTQNNFLDLQGRWHILRQVYQGDGADQLHGHWEKTAAHVDEYLNTTIRIAAFLDQRINALALYERDGILLGMISSGAGSSVEGKSSSCSEEEYLKKTWHMGKFRSVAVLIKYHLEKHGAGRTAMEYTKAAMDFYEAHKHLGENFPLNDGTIGIKIKKKVMCPDNKKRNVGGIWTKDGKLATFWNDTWRYNDIK